MTSISLRGRVIDGFLAPENKNALCLAIKTFLETQEIDNLAGKSSFYRLCCTHSLLFLPFDPKDRLNRKKRRYQLTFRAWILKLFESIDKPKSELSDAKDLYEEVVVVPEGGFTTDEIAAFATQGKLLDSDFSGIISELALLGNEDLASGSMLTVYQTAVIKGVEFKATDECFFNASPDDFIQGIKETLVRTCGCDESGYDPSILLACDPFLTRMMCRICTKIINDPKQCSGGHVFCNMCIQNVMVERSTCPVCRVHISEDAVFPNLFVSEVVNKTQVRCVSGAKNCLWTGPISDLRVHKLEECMKENEHKGWCRVQDWRLESGGARVKDPHIGKLQYFMRLQLPSDPLVNGLCFARAALWKEVKNKRGETYIRVEDDELYPNYAKRFVCVNYIANASVIPTTSDYKDVVIFTVKSQTTAPLEYGTIEEDVDATKSSLHDVTSEVKKRKL